MDLPLTSFCASLFALGLIGLTLRVVKGRHLAKVKLGDGGDTALQKRIRAHANFIEYVPFGLVLIFLNELQEANFYYLLLGCLMLAVGRGLHAYAISSIDENIKYRVMGMQLTLGSLALLASSLIALQFL